MKICVVGAQYNCIEIPMRFNYHQQHTILRRNYKSSRSHFSVLFRRYETWLRRLYVVTTHLLNFIPYNRRSIKFVNCRSVIILMCRISQFYAVPMRQTGFSKYSNTCKLFFERMYWQIYTFLYLKRKMLIYFCLPK